MFSACSLVYLSIAETIYLQSLGKELFSSIESSALLLALRDLDSTRGIMFGKRDRLSEALTQLATEDGRGERGEKV